MLRQQELAVSASVPRNARADVAVVSLVAGGAVVAGVVLTAADGGAAVAAGVSWWAGTGIAVGTLLARPTVLTRVGRANIPSLVAVHACETLWTLAEV